VTNAGSGTVSVIDTGSRTVVQTVTVGLGASGIAIAGSTAVVANMLAGSVSIINLTNYSVSNISLPVGSRPHEVAISAQGNNAVITTPMTNGFLILDLGTRALTQVSTGPSNGMGPRAVALSGNAIYIANQMTASVTIADLAAASVVKTFTVDPGPISLAVNASKNQLLVLAEGTGTLDIVDLTSYAIVQRTNVADTERQGQFTMPLIASITPNIGSIGTTLTVTITGSGFQSAQGIEFLLGGNSGMMGGGSGAFGQADPNIQVSNIQVNATGTQITASIQILSAAATGGRQVRLQTTFGTVMGMGANSLFTVTR
jgi:YVTN family beta-propeller protein